jgi:hypothetical protein
MVLKVRSTVTTGVKGGLGDQNRTQRVLWDPDSSASWSGYWLQVYSLYKSSSLMICVLFYMFNFNKNLLGKPQ